jgi:hypothetical protein
MQSAANTVQNPVIAQRNAIAHVVQSFIEERAPAIQSLEYARTKETRWYNGFETWCNVLN